MSVSISCRINLGTRVTGIPLYANAGVFSNERPSGNTVIIRGPLTNYELVEAEVLGWTETKRARHTFNFEAVNK